jgi:hypothetical protein
MKTRSQAAGSTGFGIDSIIRTIVFLSREVGNFAERKNQNGGSWGYEPPR